jgi:hypothetical protein
MRETQKMKAFQLVCGGKKAGICNVQVGENELHVWWFDGTVKCMKVSKQVAQVLQDIGFGM